MVSRRRAALGAIGVVLAAMALLIPATNGPGSAMDEGSVVAYSGRILSRAVPHRDFATFYGPGNLWIVAGAFEIAGRSVGTERGVGLAYRMAIVLALFVIGRQLGGVAGGVFAGVLAASTMAVEQVWASATYGALAASLVGMALAVTGLRGREGRTRDLWLAGSGIAMGVAVLIRFDVVPVVALVALPLLLYGTWRARCWFALPFAAVGGVYLPYLAVVGFDRVRRVIEDLRATEPGRTLPRPPITEFPGDVWALGVLASVCFVALGALVWRRDSQKLEARVLVSAGLLGIGLLPWTLSRADEFHIRPATIVATSLLPAALLFAARWIGVSARSRAVVTASLAVVAVLVALDQGSIDRIRELPTARTAYRGFFQPTDPARTVVRRAMQLARPGDSLFVGPQDLRRTNYGPTFIYFLLPQLRPASYYMEMNPKTANREGSGLADDLHRADWLILTSQWDGWSEPNESTDFGPNAPNEVVRDDFCIRLKAGSYRLYERCDRDGHST